MPYTYFPVINQNVSWGGICGNISNQTDLANLIDSKSDIDHSHGYQDNEFFLYVDFSRYGAVSTTTYFHQEKVNLPEEYIAEIVSAQMYLSSGSLVLSVLLNSQPIGELSELDVGDDYIRKNISMPVSIADSDTISINIESATESSDLYFKLCILMKRQ